MPANQMGKSWRVSSYSNWNVQFLVNMSPPSTTL